MIWKNLQRPGPDFARVIAACDAQHGDRYRIAYVAHGEALHVFDACTRFYEASYQRWLAPQPILLDKLCAFNAVTVQGTHDNGGVEYTTCAAEDLWYGNLHAVAIRRVLASLGLRFAGSRVLVLPQVGTPPSTLDDLDARWFGPDFVPFYDPRAITGPSMRSRYSLAGSVADFWVSNRWVQIPMTDPSPVQEPA